MQSLKQLFTQLNYLKSFSTMKMIDVNKLIPHIQLLHNNLDTFNNVNNRNIISINDIVTDAKINLNRLQNDLEISPLDIHLKNNKSLRYNKINSVKK